MKSPEDVWLALERAGERGGSRLVDDEHKHQFYASLNVEGNRGLLIVSGAEPPPPPAFEAVDIATTRRPDGWLISIWLKEPMLSTIFAELCQNLVDSSGAVDEADLPAFVFSRMLQWRRLLEAGSLETLGINALRGLVAELIVLKQSLEVWPPQEAVLGWVGPYHAPQDFAWPSLLMEAKAVMASASTVRISSIEQLDVPTGSDLRLAVVTLAPVAKESRSGFSVTSLVQEIRDTLAPQPQALADFEARLRSAGFSDHKNYDETCFRLESSRYYAVKDAFPRLVRADLPRGITKASYEISVGSCERYEVTLGTQQ